MLLSDQEVVSVLVPLSSVCSDLSLSYVIHTARGAAAATVAETSQTAVNRTIKLVTSRA